MLFKWALLHRKSPGTDKLDKFEQIYQNSGKESNQLIYSDSSKACAISGNMSLSNLTPSH